DLMAGLGAKASPKMDWRPWRWTLVLAAAVLLVNIGALNFDWWRMKSEANSLRSAMIQIYKSAYPNETVIIDPIAQMQQKIAVAKRVSGQAAADDFTTITATFGEAWNSVKATLPASPSIAALEYRDRSLYVRMKHDSEAPTLQMKAALAMRNLSLDLAPEQSGVVVWHIRSTQ
ncbi:MAG: type II secretion system protein GspL, partial [Gallionella sp.]